MLVPFDYDENGRMDILVQKYDQATKRTYVELIYNNIYYDKFFVQTIMFAQEDKIKQKGAIISGATFRFVVTTLDDKKS